MRTQALWKVITHIALARAPTSAETRSRISAAALLVKVMASTCPGWTPRAARRWAMRWVSTRVLPEPAPATMSSGPPSWSTASRCCGLSPTSSCSGSAPGRAAPGPPSGPSPAAAASAQVGTPAALTSAAWALARVAASTCGSWPGSPKSRPSKRVLMSGSTLRVGTDPSRPPRPGDAAHEGGGRDHHRGPGRPWGVRLTDGLGRGARPVNLSMRAR